jgi:hypothetical protein
MKILVVILFLLTTGYRALACDEAINTEQNIFEACGYSILVTMDGGLFAQEKLFKFPN